MKHSIPNPLHLADLAAVGVIAGAWLQIIPAIAAAVAALWYLLQIWESKTVQSWRKKPAVEKFSDFDGDEV